MIFKYKNLFAALILFLGSVLSMLQVLRGAWPHNHEMDSFIRWTLLYAAHQTKLDLFPIWSMSDNYFFGGPSPLLYHKVFYFISALFQNLFNNNQFSIILAVLFFSFRWLCVYVYSVIRSHKVLARFSFWWINLHIL